MNVIPAIDLRGGRCVRLFQGDFARETTYDDDPLVVCRYFNALAVDHLHVVDLDGALTGAQANTDVIRRIAAESRLSLQLGGGIRDTATLERWFDAGVDRCVIGSVAATSPQQVFEWLHEFGCERLVLAFDVKIDEHGNPMVATDGWTHTSAVDLWTCIDTYIDGGMHHVLCTDISRDGALSGPNVDLYHQILARYPGLGLQASGGVRGANDLRALANAGVPAAISGRALLDGRITESEVASFRQNA